MALLRRKSKVSDTIPTSSMADIAFLLLVFFLTTTVFDEEVGLQVVLPERGPESEQEVSPKNLLFFLIQPDGSVVIRRGESQAEQRATARQVEGIMRQALGQNPLVIGVIQTSPQASYEDMINVLDGIQSAGAERFSLQLLEQ
ncbi:MAG TPA: biopolymer transporter ExbD [Longimicrobiaceae bacterium]|jgi:biopolymer transport protein ExbD